jgi:hypothetical protein
MTKSKKVLILSLSIIAPIQFCFFYSITHLPWPSFFTP